LEPLKTALKLEIEGRSFFVEAARKVTGQQTRRTFEFLAAEEDKHILHIRRFYESIEKGDISRPPGLDETAAERNLVVFDKMLADLKDELQPTATDIEAYEYALKFENGAEDFYREKMNESDNSEVKQFYQWLIGEEELHSKVLESCLKFARDPAAWFKDRE
ncbi:MAG: ferritin family protein, partial [Proteobacteria bacterium]|nr:ferritin family protein [Pseudomonadota bacterium]